MLDYKHIQTQLARLVAHMAHDKHYEVYIDGNTEYYSMDQVEQWWRYAGIMHASNVKGDPSVWPNIMRITNSIWRQVC